MTLKAQIYTRALALTGELSMQKARLLELLCGTSSIALESMLRDGVTPNDCMSDFLIAAAMMAVAALIDATGDTPQEQIEVGDFSVQKSAVSHDAASAVLMKQAELIMAPYLKDRFAFLGV